jgi:hypothetical protein
MAYKKLTETGKDFIRNVANKANGTALLVGKNGLLPFSDETTNKIWTANVIWTGNDNDSRNGTPITTNSTFAEYLIFLFDTYSEQYEMDANIIAAQAYQESKYRTWFYKSKNTPSGISQLPMNTVYDVLYNKVWVTTEEKDIITNGMIEPQRNSSWHKNRNEKFLNKTNYETQETNRSILHQNMIDNPHIIIKMQCGLMDFISERNANLASSSLFAYNREIQLSSKNYIELINKTSREFTNDYANGGIIYAEEIFGYLGDKDNKFITTLDNSTKGYWFGYKQLNLGSKWNDYEADSKSKYVVTRSTKSIGALDKELRIGYEGAKVKFKEVHGDTYIINLTSVYRTPEFQRELYNVGRNSRNEIIGKTLTPLDGFDRKSKHNDYKTKAFDYGIFTSSNLYLNGKTNAFNRALYEQFAEFVIDIVPNAVWGGDFKNQKNDVVHIQLN